MSLSHFTVPAAPPKQASLESKSPICEICSTVVYFSAKDFQVM